MNVEGLQTVLSKVGDDLNERELQKVLARPLRHGVYYYYSTEEYLVRDYAAKTLALLQRQESDAEVTHIEGPAPPLDEVITAAQMISMFGTRRIVELSLLPSAMTDKDAAALCDLMKELDNTVLVMSTVFKEKKAMTTKRAKLLIGAAEKAGVAVCLEKPELSDVKAIAMEKAQELGASLTKRAASELVERCGTDLFTLESELAKLAAACGYGEITPEWVKRMGTQSIETGVFDMIDLVIARREAEALDKLGRLFALQNKPPAILGALSDSFVNMYRIKCSAAVRRDANAIYKDFSCTGSSFPLIKASRTAPRYTLRQLEQALAILADLDLAMKSSAADDEALLQTALCELMQIGSAR